MTKENLIETKITDFLTEKYKDIDSDKGVSILNEKENTEHISENEKYRERLKEILQLEGKNLAKMNDNEKREILDKVKKSFKNE